MQTLGPILDVSGKVWPQTCIKYRPGVSNSQVRLFFHTSGPAQPSRENFSCLLLVLMHRFLFFFSLPFDIGCKLFKGFNFMHRCVSISEGLNALALPDHAVGLLSSIKLSSLVAAPIPGLRWDVLELHFNGYAHQISLQLLWSTSLTSYIYLFFSFLSPSSSNRVQLEAAPLQHFSANFNFCANNPILTVHLK